MLQILSVLAVLSFGVLRVQSTSFVPSVSHQWPYNQWTSTTESPPPKPSQDTSSYAIIPEWTHSTESPPPPQTVVPPRTDESNYIIATDPNTGRQYNIPKTMFYDKFGIEQQPIAPPAPSSSPNQLICDLYTNRCWMRNTNKPPGPPQATGPYARRRTTTTPEPAPLIQPTLNTEDEFETRAATWSRIPPQRNGNDNQWYGIYQPQRGDNELLGSHNVIFFPFKRATGSGIGGTILCQNKEDCNPPSE